MSTKQSEQKEIIRLDKSNSRITGSLEERQKRDEGKKKKRKKLNSGTLLPASLGNKLQILSRVLEWQSPRRPRVCVD